MTPKTTFTLPLPNGDVVEFAVLDLTLPTVEPDTPLGNLCCESPTIVGGLLPPPPYEFTTVPVESTSVDFLESVQLVGEQFVADVTEAILRRNEAMGILANRAQEAGLDHAFWDATVDMVASEADAAIAEVERNVC